jgi:hypothetical protein
VNSTDDRNEQRVSQRHPFITFCWYKRIDDVAEDDEEAVAQLRDISEGGIGVLTANALPIGARLLVEIVSKVGRVSVLGKVTHCAPSSERSFRTGVKVYSIPPNDQLTWRRMLAP